MNKIKKITGQLFKKSFWLSLDLKNRIEQEARTKWKSESEFVRHIISKYFEK